MWLLEVRGGDVEASAVQGIAITGATSVNGNWQFSIDGGVTYTNFASYSAGTAPLLAATDLVRVNPNAQNGGAHPFSYNAWGQPTRTHGLTAGACSPGGATAVFD